jgi:hypothetical protein
VPLDTGRPPSTHHERLARLAVADEWADADDAGFRARPAADGGFGGDAGDSFSAKPFPLFVDAGSPRLNRTRSVVTSRASTPSIEAPPLPSTA